MKTALLMGANILHKANMFNRLTNISIWGCICCKALKKRTRKKLEVAKVPRGMEFALSSVNESLVKWQHTLIISKWLMS